jgi:CBS domain-containing protein
MADKVRDVMSTDPIVLHQDETIADAARAMRANSVGAVLVADGDRLRGLVTDRDIVVRAVADDKGPQTPVAQVCSAEIVAVDAGEDAGEAVRLMREHAVRRLPVIDNGQLAGIVSLGDLAEAMDHDSALGQISAAAPNT